MKKLFFALCIALGLSLNAYAAAETKRVCNIVKDAKTKKSKEVCKNIKVHKKLEPSKKK